jgi:hypothetical protein
MVSTIIEELWFPERVHLRTASAICDFLRREDELMTELMNHKRSTS